MKKISTDGRSAFFICCVLITLFFQLFYKQFYGANYRGDIQTTITSDTEQINKEKEYSENFLDKHEYNIRLQATQINKDTITLLKKEAERILEIHINAMTVKCEGKKYFFDEYTYNNKLHAIHETSNIKVKAKHIDRSGTRIREPQTRDKIQVEIKAKVNAYSLSNKDWTWEKEKYIIGGWTFYINNKTLMLEKYPPSIKSKNSGDILMHPFMFPKYPNTSKSKYRCDDIPLWIREKTKSK